MTTIVQLKKAAHAATEALFAAQAIETDKQNKKLVGKCFKYLNSGGGCDEKWWFYNRITGAADGRVQVMTFEVMPNGNISIEPSQSASGGRFVVGGGYIPISRMEFDEAWSVLLAAVDQCPA